MQASENLGSVVAVALVAMFIASSTGYDLYFLRTLSHDDDCHAPLEGEWHVENRVHVIGSDELQLNGTIALNLTKPADNVYKGEGLLQVLVPTPVHDAKVEFVALFDPETCVLSGSIFARPLGAAFVFRWNSVGSQASGPFLLKLNGTLASTTPGVNNAKYVVA